MIRGYQNSHMGNAKGHKVMVLSPALWFLIALPCLVFSYVCKPGKEFLDTEKQKCANCTVCEPGLVVLRPCEVHRDTICGTISQLTLDWNSVPKTSEVKHRNGHNRHRHHHEQRILWNFGDDDKTEQTVQTKNRRIEERVLFETSDVTSTEVAFSNAETLVWDWQAIALTLAIFACILFFLVIALYSLHQAKQWRRLKENFEADVEELSVKLSLMSANSTSEKGDTLEPKLGQLHQGNYLKSRCIYLEQLLNVRKDTKIISDKKGNVYIEEANPNGKT